MLTLCQIGVPGEDFCAHVACGWMSPYRSDHRKRTNSDMAGIAEFTTLETIGTHYIVEMFGCPEHLLNDEAFVNVAMREAVIASDAELIEGVSHQFSPQGVTALGLLSESHISIHTWPEHGYVAADIFTCGTRANPYKACTHLIEAFQAGRHILKKLTRGIDPEDPNARNDSDDQMVVSTSTVSTT